MPKLYGVDRVTELYPEHCEEGKAPFRLYPEPKCHMNWRYHFLPRTLTTAAIPYKDTADLCQKELGNVLLERLPPSAKNSPPENPGIQNVFSEFPGWCNLMLPPLEMPIGPVIAETNGNIDSYIPTGCPVIQPVDLLSGYSNGLQSSLGYMRSDCQLNPFNILASQISGRQISMDINPPPTDPRDILWIGVQFRESNAGLKLEEDESPLFAKDSGELHAVLTIEEQAEVDACSVLWDALPFANEEIGVEVKVVSHEVLVRRALYQTFSYFEERLQKDEKIWGKSCATIALLLDEECHEKSGPLTPAGLNESANHKRVLYTANVGDTRAVLCRGGKAVELTVEHKPNQPDELKRLKRAQRSSKHGPRLRSHPAPDGSIIHRVGNRSNSRTLRHPSPYVLAVPDVSRTELQDNDEFLILASDGLWDAIRSNDEAVTLVRNVLDPLE